MYINTYIKLRGLLPFWLSRHFRISGTREGSCYIGNAQRSTAQTEAFTSSSSPYSLRTTTRYKINMKKDVCSF
jgi:hypothetical protein